MVNAISRSSLLLVALLALAGCEEPSRPASELPEPTFGQASISGVVKFVGVAPERRMIDIGEACVGGPNFVQEETVVVAGDGGLRDVIVFLKDAPASFGKSQPRAKLDQVGCQYLPHVLAIQQGQPLAIATSDTVFHNVHWVSGTNPGKNLGFPANSASQVVTFDRPEFVRMRCDVHPWMEAHVGVMPNPFFAVSATDGRFTIERVPAGTYTLVVWHAMLGERSKPVTVGPDGTVTADFEFARGS